MRTLFTLFFGLCLASGMVAQVPSPAPSIPADVPDLEKLAAPIALYPDSLVALILPASTTPSDIVLAARFLASGGTEAQVDAEPWNDSVKSLTRYPELLKWMDENLAWTQTLGEAFAEKPAEVMNAIQRLRAKARADGILDDTAEQKVIVAGEIIYITPARRDTIYIPYYEPDIFWVRRPVHGYVSFSVGFTIGNWLYYDCDWGNHSIWVHQRSPSWIYRPGWRPHIHPSPGVHWAGRPHRPIPGRPHRPVPYVKTFRGPTHHTIHPNTPDGGRHPSDVRGPHGPTVRPAPAPSGHAATSRPAVRSQAHPRPHASDSSPRAEGPSTPPSSASVGAVSRPGQPERQQPRATRPPPVNPTPNASPAPERRSSVHRGGATSSSGESRRAAPVRTEARPSPSSSPRPAPAAPAPAAAAAPAPAPAAVSAAAPQDHGGSAAEARAQGSVRRR